MKWWWWIGVVVLELTYIQVIIDIDDHPINVHSEMLSLEGQAFLGLTNCYNCGT